MSFLLTLHHEDDLLAVIDRVITAPDDDIALLIPEGARILGSEENFVLLKREAAAAGKRIAIRTADARGRFLASKAGIPVVQRLAPPTQSSRVFSDIVAPTGAAPAQDERPVSAPASEPVPEPMQEVVPVQQAQTVHAAAPEAVQDEPLPFLGGSTKPEKQQRSRPKRERRKMQMPSVHLSIPASLKSSKTGAVAIALAGVLIAFLVANEVLLRVDVRVVPRTEAITLPVTARVTVGEAAEGAVPGQRVSVTERVERSVDASGQGQRSERATGTITIESSHASDQTLVATTRFVSQDGKLFRLDNTLVVPANGSADAAVTADEAGPDYNIGPSTFSIPGFQGDPRQFQFVARSREAMRGGASGQVRVVTAEDVAKAREGIEEQARTALERAFAAQVVSDLVVIEDAREETITVSLDQEADSVADAVKATAEGTLSAIAYRQSDLEAAVLGALRERIAEGTDIVAESVVMNVTVTDTDAEAGTLDLSIAVEARAAWQVDEELVKRQVAGNREEEIRSWLSTYNPVERAQIEFRPFWVRVAPDNPDRIRVETGLDVL
jgi:hypothetical protein